VGLIPGVTFTELRKGITHLFYPDLCEGCNSPLVAHEEVLCIGCETLVPETNYDSIADNDTVVRFAGRIPFQHATSFAYFTEDGLLQHMLHGLKYRGRKEIGEYFGRRFARRLHTTDWISTVDAIIPVPLHLTRMQRRGYNQSQVIAEAMSETLQIPSLPNVLARVRNTESQVNKTRHERTENMRSAFAVTDNNAIAGKHILILDDVLTTGATIEACAAALLAVEGVKISIVTIGIAVS
jgi:ComF family protein